MTAEQHSSVSEDDQRLTEAFEPAVLGMLPGEGAPVHAETLLALCLADGVLEVLEWAREGTGADPAASLWLGALRWYRLVTGDFPAGAPQPRSRPTDYALRRINDAGALGLIPGSADESLDGLSSGEMNVAPKSHSGAKAAPTPGAGRGPAEVPDSLHPALSRVVPLGLVPFVELGMKQDWAAQAVFLTHPDPQLVAAARELTAELHVHAGWSAPTAGNLPTEIETSHVNSRSISQNAGKTGNGGPGGGDSATHREHNELLTVVVQDLAHRWRAVAV